MEQGRQWYDRAFGWSQQGEQNVAELFRFQVEAAKVLGLDPPKQPEIAEGAETLHRGWFRTTAGQQEIEESHSDSGGQSLNPVHC